jgi:hypothetical protein
MCHSRTRRLEAVEAQKDLALSSDLPRLTRSGVSRREFGSYAYCAGRCIMCASETGSARSSHQLIRLSLSETRSGCIDGAIRQAVAENVKFSISSYGC